MAAAREGATSGGHKVAVAVEAEARAPAESGMAVEGKMAARVAVA